MPSIPLTKALSYAHERRERLEAYLNDPEIPIDNNNLERALRAISMGRNNGFFCWTETGAEHVGVVQSLLPTCRLHDIDPYEYLVDVLQRVKTHRPLQMGELTPRRRKELFVQNPKRSVPHLIDQMRNKEVYRRSLNGAQLPLTHAQRAVSPSWRPTGCNTSVYPRLNVSRI